MGRKVIVYGSKISSDIDLEIDLPRAGTHRYQIELSSAVPQKLKGNISCGFPFYFAHGRNVYLYSDRELDGSEPGQPWCYEVKGVVRFYWTGGQRTIYYELDEGSPALLGFWFIHLVLPLFYTLEDMYDFLHAGAVAINGKPILLIAPTMGGKSTLTNYFIRQGHALVSDDKVATFVDHNRFMVVGSHPYHRPYRKFEELGYRVEKFAADATPIHCIYSLEKKDEDAEIAIEEIKGFEKFDTLMPNYLYMFSYLRPRRLRYLSALLNEIRVFRLQLPWDKTLLPEVHAVICNHNCETK